MTFDSWLPPKLELPPLPDLLHRVDNAPRVSAPPVVHVVAATTPEVTVETTPTSATRVRREHNFPRPRVGLPAA